MRIKVEKKVDAVQSIMGIIEKNLGGWKEMGGPGSGNIGHAGRPGQRGGSRPSGRYGGVSPSFAPLPNPRKEKIAKLVEEYTKMTAEQLSQEYYNLGKELNKIEWSSGGRLRFTAELSDKEQIRRVDINDRLPLIKDIYVKKIGAQS